MTDLVTFGEATMRLSPPRGGRLETTPSLDVRVSGPESNAAVGAARLGVDAAWLSKLPASALGRRVVAALRSHGVRTGIAWTDAEAGRVGTVYEDRGAATHGTTAIDDRAGSAFTTVTPADLPDGVVESTDRVHTTGATLGVSDRARETALDLLEAAGEADVRRSLALRHRDRLWDADRTAPADRVYREAFDHVETLFVSRSEARSVLSCEGDAVEIVHSLRTEFDLETVVLTRDGAETGAVAIDAGAVHEGPAYRVDSRDPSGTDDAFVAGFLTERIAGGSVPDALELGAATAALTGTIDGEAAIVSREAVDAVIADPSALDR
ncbi:sugar kinase [Halopenitus persicus]|uniref:sugar kinase n=1 Tax=Halopenitus persicus TaxID=1048396 RepID=UPI000BBA5CF2|nr:sugar kinase [Halopenitus persicus]